MVSTRCCCLCGKKSSTTFHLFPKDPTGLSLWKQICNFKVYDDVSRLLVCSNHFTPDDYLEPNAKQLGGKLRLKRDRIPSVSVPNRIDNHQKLCSTAIKSKHEENEDVPVLETTKPGTSPPISVPSKPLHKESKGGNATTVIVHPLKPRVTLSISVENEFDESQHSTASKCKDEDIPVVEVIQPRTRSSISLLNKRNIVDDLKDGNLSEQQSSTVPVTEEHKRKGVPDDAQPHTPKRRFHEPRYFGDVTLSDVSTPKKAKRAIMLAREQIKRQNSKNRALQQKNRRLQKKIDGLQELVHELKQKKV